MDTDMRPAGRPLRLLSLDDSGNQRLDKIETLLPWNLSAEYRQICHEQNLTMSLPIRQFIAKFVAEHKGEQ